MDVNPTVASATALAKDASTKIAPRIGALTATALANTALIALPIAHPVTANSISSNPTTGVQISLHAGVATTVVVAYGPTPGVGPTAITADVVVTLPVLEIVVAWWNSSYHFRRELILTNAYEDVFAGHAIQWDFDFTNQYNYGKTRVDFEDVEIIHDDGGQVPTFTVLSREITDTYVRFQLIDNIAKGTSSAGHYFVYFGNWDLDSQPDRPEYVEDLWSVSKASNSINLSYTRPGEYWRSGFASNPKAVATMYFFGERVRVESYTGPTYGIAEISVDGQNWVVVDMYNPLGSIQPVFEATNLTSTEHKLRLKPAGRKNPVSLSEEINFVSIDYLTPIIVTDKGEEVKNVDWASVVTGVG